MSKLDLRIPDAIEKEAAGFAIEGTSFDPVASHAHRKAELVHLISGNLTIQSADGIWVIPPGRALWIPPGITHSSRLSGELRVQCIFFEPDLSPHFPPHCHLVFVHPLLREILARLSRSTPDTVRDKDRERRLVAVLLDELAATKSEPFHLPLPADKGLQVVTRRLLEEPTLQWSIADWAREVGSSPSTLTRRFQRELGMTLGKWRQLLHVQVALRELAQGITVSTIAYDLGYDSPSAFIAMFKRNTGQTPGSLVPDADTAAGRAHFSI